MRHLSRREREKNAQSQNGAPLPSNGGRTVGRTATHVLYFNCALVLLDAVWVVG